METVTSIVRAGVVIAGAFFMLWVCKLIFNGIKEWWKED